MRLLFSILLLTTLSLSCKSQDRLLKKMADSVCAYFMRNVPQIKKVDTIYLQPEVITPRRRALLQSQDYRYAYYEALLHLQADSAALRDKSLELLNGAILLDSTSFVCYHVMPLVVFHLKNDFIRSGTAEFFLDSSLNFTPLSSIITKVSAEPERGIKSRAYYAWTPEQYEMLQKEKVAKFYY